MIYSDVYQCFDGTPEGTQAASSYPYQVNGNELRILVRTPKEDILAALDGLDANAQFLAQSLLVNDLQFILVLTPL